MIICSVIFWISAFIIVWGMAGYSLSLKILNKILKKRGLEKSKECRPLVSVMIVAHNEEKVILNKLRNVIDNDYPKDLIEYVIASDFSTDATNLIVQQFIENHPEVQMTLYESQNHGGKTNAQNEAQKITKGEILVMTDANAMFEHNAISELVSCFAGDDIAYVTGKLVYQNADDNDTAASESTYWESDLSQRQIESDLGTITAGNGAIYACRNDLYYDFPAIECHDSSMPYYYAKNGKRSVYNADAIAYEKAGEVTEDEFSRKVRMNRIILKAIKDGGKALNVKKFGSFSYFYFGHRTCRYLLWLAHTLVFITSMLNAPKSIFYQICFIGQVVFYVIAIINHFVKSSVRIFNLITYYSMTILAQWRGVINCLTGKSKAVWNKAESTR